MIFNCVLSSMVSGTEKSLDKLKDKLNLLKRSKDHSGGNITIVSSIANFSLVGKLINIR